MPGLTGSSAFASSGKVRAPAAGAGTDTSSLSPSFGSLESLASGWAGSVGTVDLGMVGDAGELGAGVRRKSEPNAPGRSAMIAPAIVAPIKIKEPSAIGIAAQSHARERRDSDPARDGASIDEPYQSLATLAGAPDLETL
jgi:hypothetical protein